MPLFPANAHVFAESHLPNAPPPNRLVAAAMAQGNFATASWAVPAGEEARRRGSAGFRVLRVRDTSLGKRVLYIGALRLCSLVSMLCVLSTVPRILLRLQPQKGQCGVGDPLPGGARGFECSCSAHSDGNRTCDPAPDAFVSCPCVIPASLPHIRGTNTILLIQAYSPHLSPHNLARQGVLRSTAPSWTGPQPLQPPALTRKFWRPAHSTPLEKSVAAAPITAVNGCLPAAPLRRWVFRIRRLTRPAVGTTPLNWATQPDGAPDHYYRLGLSRQSYSAPASCGVSLRQLSVAAVSVAACVRQTDRQTD